jgi:hypothetical protein
MGGCVVVLLEVGHCMGGCVEYLLGWVIVWVVVI